jgi:hypothetical protein
MRLFLRLFSKLDKIKFQNFLRILKINANDTVLFTQKYMSNKRLWGLSGIDDYT